MHASAISGSALAAQNRSFQPTEKAARKAERTVAKLEAIERRANKSPKSAKGVVKRIMDSQSKLAPRLSEWLTLLQDPFNSPTVRCPVNYNPVPSWRTTLARTTTTVLDLTVPGTQCIQLTMFPGHGSSIQKIMPTVVIANPEIPLAMDGVSYHSLPQRCRDYLNNPIFASVGPMSADNFPPSCVFLNGYHSIVPTGTYVTTTANSIPMGWDTALPYQTGTSNATGAHARWKCTAAGIKFRNITPELTRGGNVVTVIPTGNQVPIARLAGTGFNQPANGQSDWEVHPTFTDHGCPEKTVEVSWIPRAEDLAYWHTVSYKNDLGNDVSDTRTSNAMGGAMQVFLNAPAGGEVGNPQTYSIEIVYHWELSGNLLAAVSTPSVHQPADKNVVEPSIALHLNAASSAKGIVATATHVAKTIMPMVMQGAATAGKLAGSSGGLSKFLEYLGH